MKRTGFLLFSTMLLTLSSARADSMFIQTAAGTGGMFTDTSRVQAAGTNDTPTLTLNIPAASSFVTALLQPFSGTKTSSTTTLFVNINIVEDNASIVYSASSNTPFTVSIPLTETVVAGNATFSTPGGSPSYHILTNGEFLEIQPLANADLSSNSTIQANFSLLSTSPEPASVMLTALGFAGLVLFARRRARSHRI